MEDIAVLARIVLRDPLTLVAGLIAAVLISIGWLWLLKDRGWPLGRKVCALLSATSLGFALSIVLVREDITFGRSWYCLTNPGVFPGNAEEALNLVLFAPAAFFAALVSRRLWLVGVVFACLSVAVEVIHKLIDVGTCEFGDMTRNATGAVSAIFVVWLARALRKSMQQSGR